MARNEYDLAEAFRRIENELMASMIRNMDRHRAEETKEGYNWSMWQAEQLKALEKYKRKNQKKYQKQFKSINSQIEQLIRRARMKGNMKQEIRILQAIRKGWKTSGTNRSPAHDAMTAEFFKLNERKLDALIEATTHDMEAAETAVLRKANDDYRKAIFNAQVYANSGAGTYEKAVDMATKDMLSRGLNCVMYANGARHTLADYADMAIRTASKRAYLQGEGEKRQEWGIATVIMAKRGNPCPKCLPFVGKVLIDDVWSGGSKDGVDPETGKRYPLMSYAISKGLYHPRCKDSHTTYFPGISTADDTWTKEELENSLDQENKRVYKGKKEMWKNIAMEAGSDIMNAEETKEVADVHIIGRIDRYIYKCVSEDIRTDEVIITDNQIQHIKERHPNDYERFSEYFSEIVEVPDYIIESPKPNTALVLKEIVKADEVFKTVVRLATSGDNPAYKNSIITFMKIDEKEWNRLLRNKKILYKRE